MRGYAARPALLQPSMHLLHPSHSRHNNLACNCPAGCPLVLLPRSMEASEMLPSLHTTARLAAEVAQGAQLLLHDGDISCEQ